MSWTCLLSASQPSYWPEGLLGRIVTFNQGILNARRCYLRVAWDDAFDSELYGPIEIVDWQVGVFQNHRLITWADTGADIPADVVKEFDDRNGGRKDYLGYRVLRIPDFRIAWREGMTAEFLLTSNGETTAVPGALGEGNRFSALAVTVALTDDISLSVVFTLPDGSR